MSRRNDDNFLCDMIDAAVDLDRVWDTVKDDLPPLIVQLEKIVSK